MDMDDSGGDVEELLRYFPSFNAFAAVAVLATMPLADFMALPTIPAMQHHFPWLPRTLLQEGGICGQTKQIIALQISSKLFTALQSS